MPHGDNDGRIDYVEFAAQDLQRVRAFYEQLFGWQFTDYGPEYTAFQDGRLDGGFRRGEPTSGGTLAVVYALDLEAVQAKVEAVGGSIVAPIFSFPGGRRFHFKDPGGNELAVWSDK